MVPIFGEKSMNVGEKSMTKNYRIVRFFLWLVKSLKNL